MSITYIFITLTLSSFFSCISSSSTGAAPALANNYELATQVCNATTDAKFCINTFTSDPSYQPLATADAVSLAYIIFSKAYLVATGTQTNIMSNITKIGVKRSVNLHGLQNCQSYYTNAVAALYQVLENLDSETYCYFDKLSDTARSNVTACGKGLRRNQMVPLARENDNFVNLAGICYAVATLFQYSC